MIKRAVTKLIFAAILTLVQGRGSVAADAKPTRIAYPSAAASFIPLWAAQDGGFFKKENLYIELLAIRSSPIVLDVAEE